MKCYVYLIKIDDFDFVKIGYTVNLKSRFNSITANIPFKTNYIKVKEFYDCYTATIIEKRLHITYNKNKIECKGREWFKLNDTQINEVADFLDKCKYKIKNHTLEKLTQRKNEPKIEFSIKDILGT